MRGMEVKKDHYLSRIIRYTILVVLISSAIICITVVINSKHFYMASTMPIVALVLFFLNKTNIRAFDNISLLVINISMALRYGLYPALLMLSGEDGLYYADDTEVILLMLYELIGIFSVISIKGKQLICLVETKEVVENSSYIGVVTLLLIVFMIPAAIISPSLLRQFSLSSLTIKQVDESTQGFIISFFSMGVWTLLVFVLGSLGKITKNEKSYVKGISLLISIIISLLYLVSKVISGTNIRRWVIICSGLAISIILIRVFPQKRKRIIWIATIGIIIGVIFGSLIKYNETSSIYGFIIKHGSYSSLDLYFSGIKSVRDGLSTIDTFSTTKSFNSTLTDLFSGMPFISRLFNAKTDGVPALYQAYIGRTDLICPMIVQSVAHFGIIGAPILSMMYTYLALEFNNRYKGTSNLYEVFVYVEMMFYSSLVMELNTLIIMGVIWIRLIYLAMLKFDYKLYISWDKIKK